MQRAFFAIPLACALLAAAAAAQEPDYYAEPAAPAALAAQGPVSEHVIDSPKAVVPGHGDFRVSARVMAGGSVVAHTEVGIQGRIAVGVSWGMLGLLGREDVETYDNTGLMARVLLVDQEGFPSLAVGFDNQGYGAWDDGLDRYERKSKGFYLTGTQHWYGLMGEDLGTTFGVNYTLEEEDGEDQADLFFALEQEFNQAQLAFLADYTAGLNDRRHEPGLRRYGDGKGYLDLGLRWNLSEQFQLKFFFRDILNNFRDPVDGHKKAVERQLLLAYYGSF